MKKKILTILIILFAIAGIVNFVYENCTPVQAAQTDNVTENLRKSFEYSNQALDEINQKKVPEAYKTLDEVFKYLALVEKELAAKPNYNDREVLLDKTVRAKATVYALKGKLEIEFYRQNSKGIANLQKALELDTEKAAETLLTYASVAILQSQFSIAEIYVDQILAAQNVPDKYLTMAKRLKEELAKAGQKVG